MKIILYDLCSGCAAKPEMINVKRKRITNLKTGIKTPTSIQKLKNSKPLIDYTYDSSLRSLSDKKLNTLILYQFLNEDLRDPKDAIHRYARLNYFQKMMLNAQFNKCWLQKTENVMWLINIVVAILAVVFAAKAI